MDPEALFYSTICQKDINEEDDEVDIEEETLQTDKVPEETLPKDAALFAILRGTTDDDDTDNFLQIMASSKREKYPWAHPTCFHVLEYVRRLQSNFENGRLGEIIRSLDDLVNQNKYAMKAFEGQEEILAQERALVEESYQQIFELFENSVLPEVHKFLTTPQLHLHLSHKHTFLSYPNEYMLCFIDFLLDMLHRAAMYINSNDKQRCGKLDDSCKQIMYDVLEEDLTCLLTILGDVPFQFTHDQLQQDGINILMSHFETVASDIGCLVYSCVFEKFTSDLFHERRDEAMEKIIPLYEIIRQHCCIIFSDLPRCEMATSRTNNPIDLLSIVDSLLKDLDNLMNFGCKFTSEDMVDSINRLLNELRILESLLKNLKVHQNKGMTKLRDLSVIEIRDLMYEAEYLIISYIVGNLPIWYLNCRLPYVVGKIEITRQKLQENPKIYYSSSKGITKSFREASFEHVITPVGVDDLVVGFEDDIKKILNDLMGGPKNLHVVSIVGMPGLGKTTIAKKLYHGPYIGPHFDRRGWCVMSQSCQKRKVLIEILKSVAAILNDNEIREMEDESLGYEIHKCLFGRRYLIVIDDIWDPRSFEDLKRYFPDNSEGSRILLTSRITNVATGVVHSPPLLSEEQSWELLKNKVFPGKPCPQQLTKIAIALAASCRGLPLALVVLAGILVNVGEEESAWEKVNNKLKMYMLDDVNGYMNILELSYENLPNHIKQCFLYLGIFPEDSEIQICNLLHMWIAEGFIQKTTEENAQYDVAERYLVDLISRNLLVISKRRSDGGIKACVIHDVLRDMCIKKAEEEKFLKIIKENDLSIFGNHKRFAVPSTSRTWSYIGQHCRTFVGCISKSRNSFSQMSLLRVMDTLPMEGHYGLESITFPDNLRYLVHDRMPNFRQRNFMNLEFLDIESSHSSPIPSVILKIVTLRHLRIKPSGEFSDGCDSSQTNNLEYLSAVHICNDKDVKVLKCFPRLRRLKYSCEEPIFSDFSSFAMLESLTIRSTPVIANVVNFPSTIKKLHLEGLCLPWEKMSIVGKLQNLIVLKLDCDSFVGDTWNTEDEFLELRFLKLQYLTLKEWNTCSEHFPKLQCLVLNQCMELKVREDLADIDTLETIEVHNCGELTSKSAALIGKLQEENGNTLKVIISKI